jgi:hypothetical protein
MRNFTVGKSTSRRFLACEEQLRTKYLFRLLVSYDYLNMPEEEEDEEIC